MNDFIYTCYTGKNDVLFEKISKLYFKPGIIIKDVTYGMGAFWKRTNLEQYNFQGTDLKTGVDFRKLPYDNDSVDVVILDPPYAHTPGNMMVDKTYNNAATTKGMYHKDIMKLYADGMKESYRVIRNDGYLMVKCQDEIESSKQKWSHIEIYGEAMKLGYYAKDLFVLHQDKNPIIQHKQQHARKNHSYLWVFKKQVIKTKEKYCVSCEEKIYGKETLQCDICGEPMCYYCYFKNEGACTSCNNVTNKI